MAVIYDSTGATGNSSASQTQGQTGLKTRECPIDSTTATGSLATAGDNTIFSSAATALYIYAVTMNGMGNSTTSPTAGSSAVILRFQSGTTGATSWRFTYYNSSANGWWDSLTVPPPNYLFKTAAGALLNCAATSTGANYSVAAWRE